VLRQNPDLPQGSTGTESGTRWFTLPEVATLRAHFTTTGAAHKSYTPRRPTGAQAPLIALTGPLGATGQTTGRTTATLHLACAAALAGYKVLVIDADPGGRLAHSLGAAAHGDTLMPLMARAFGLHLRQINAGRLDRGEAPLPVGDSIATALASDPASLPQPTAWPGLDILAAHPDLALADQQIAAWQNTARRWAPGQAAAQALDDAGYRQRYDLIFCDMGRGLGPLTMALLSAADILLIPVMGPTVTGPASQPPDGLTPLATALRLQDEAATMTARILGQPAPVLGWRRLCVLQIGTASRTGPSTGIESVPGSVPVATLLPHPLPLIPQISTGQTAHVYALDYRDIGRLPYAPLRDACDASWRGLAQVLSELWAEDAVEAESKTP
jgi:chromosome partitioning protein